MTGAPKHTPTPWHVGRGKQAAIVYSETGFLITNAVVYHGQHGPETSDANAVLIVRAVNSHAALVKALEMDKKISDLLWELSGSKDGLRNAEIEDELDILRDQKGFARDRALALAKGEA